MNNLKQGLMEISRLAKHAYEEWHHIWWGRPVLYKQKPTMSRKHKEAAHMAFIMNQIGQPSLKISPTWIPLICEVGRMQGTSV
jgi:hypothetical protein